MGRGCVQRGLAQFIDLREFEFALEPVQGSQQVLLLRAEITAQRVLREQVRMARGDGVQALRAVVGKARIQAKVFGQLADVLSLLDERGLKA